MSSRAMSKPELEALADFRYRLRRFLRYSETITRDHGVTPQQYQLLLQVKGFPGRAWATIAELSERLQASHHGAVALVTRCEGAGLVRRVASRADRRAVEIHLTAAGEACLDRLARLHRAELHTLRDALVDAEPAPGRRRRGVDERRT